MNVHEFQEKVADYANEHGLIQSGDNVVVALSGGADSVALLHVLMALNVNCYALHCNFRLRGAESDRDELFVRDLCTFLGVPLSVTHFDVAGYEREHKVSTEMACRELRYAWFEEKRVILGAKYIAVAHHHDDNIETFFLNMLRGTGINGLSGIKPKNGNIIRPLLCVTRKDVETYLSSCNLSFVTDSTNLENDFKRNKIRNVLIPVFKDLFPDFEQGINRTFANIQGCADFYHYSVSHIKSRCVCDSHVEVIGIDLKPLLEINKGRETALYEILKDYGFNSDQVKDMCNTISQSDRIGKRYISKCYEAVMGREEIEIFPNKKDNIVAEKTINLREMLNAKNVNNEFSVELIEKESGNIGRIAVDGKSTIALSTKILNDDISLVLREWRQGDVIHPYGMNGSKLVSDLFVDNKYTESQKRRTKVLAIEQEVLWVLGLRASRKYAVNATDSSYLKLSLKNNTYHTYKNMI